MNDRRKSSGNGKEEYFEEVNGKRLYDWEDIWYAVGSHSIGGGPPTIDFGTNNSPRYGIKLYKMLTVCSFGAGLRNPNLR